MKLILITLVALVVGMMVACTVTLTPTAAPTPEPPAYSDAEVIGAVKGHLNGVGMADGCKFYARKLASMNTNVRQDPSNRDKYLLTMPDDRDLSWTFIGSLGMVISTSKGQAGFYGC